MSKVRMVWSCHECGHKVSKWAGSCISCKNWNTLQEEVVYEEKKDRYALRGSLQTKAVKISDIKMGENPRILSKMGELDRLLGGGIVPGSLVLVGGEPGVGKSTLMLQLADALCKQGCVVLYISGEESLEQTSLRAKRLNIVGENLFLLSETQLSAIKENIEHIKPDSIVADSVQILYKDEIPSAPGSVVQVREVACEFMHLSKGKKITTFLVGHVTKTGEIAGPRVLEHLVDTVLEFEGDRQHGFRMLRSLKNRFGPTDEIAIFQMKEKGLVEIPNPSQVFLEDRRKGCAGSAIVPGLEGARSFLLEIQALISPTVFASPSRRSTGLDANRLSLLLAVLEKRSGFQLHRSDVFVALTGGLKIVEPALDLGMVLAIASSFMNRPLSAELVVLGEVGLSGEVRSVSRVETRLKEAIHMGFKRCILPKRNCKGISAFIREQIQLVGIDLVDEAIQEGLS